MIIKSFLVGLFLFAYAVVASAQPGCKTVYLPDLNPPEGVRLGGAILGGFAVPPGTSQPAGAFYPVHLHTTTNGFLNIKQMVGDSWARERWFRNVSSVSLVWWSSEFNEAFRGAFTLNGYKILPNSELPGVDATYAFHEHLPLVKEPRASFNLSMPIQLGEDWNFSIKNDFADTQWMMKAFAEARICGEEYR